MSPSLLDKHQVPDILATLDPKIPIISPSQIQVYGRCAYNWHFSYIRGWSSKPQDQAETGSLFHDLAAVYYNIRMLDPRSPEAAREAVHARLKFLSGRFTTYDQLDQLKKAGRTMIRYMETVALELDSHMRIEGVEKHFVVQLETPTGNPYYLQGYIDLFTKTRVIDHKTANSIKQFYTKDQVQFDAQLKSYVIALQKLGYSVDNASINNINTYDYKDFMSTTNDQLFRRIPAHYSKTELETFERELGFQVDEMFYTESNPYRRSIHKSCGSCYIKEACLMEQKGMDITRLLEQKYQRRPLTETYKDLVLGVDNPVRV